jgi:hypothetical protein
MLCPISTRSVNGTGRCTSASSCRANLPIRGDVQASVVVEVHRCVAESRASGAVIVSLALPQRVIHAQAVQQHHTTPACGIAEPELAFNRQRAPPTQVRLASGLFDAVR